MARRRYKDASTFRSLLLLTARFRVEGGYTSVL